ncbi:TolC family protein [Candidatus Accumulibacter phosphatis]|nr:TolC family protein [Candidatus Accumulibacter phosphatis]
MSLASSTPGTGSCHEAISPSRLLVAPAVVSSANAFARDAARVEVFKSATCACGGGWAEDPGGKGFAVTSLRVEEVPDDREKLGMWAQAVLRHSARLPAAVFTSHGMTADLDPAHSPHSQRAVCWPLRLAACLVGVLLSLSGMAASPPAAPEGSLGFWLEEAWLRNPQAKAVDAREGEARAAQELASGLTPEPGSVSVGALNDQLNSNRGKREIAVELNAYLWLPGQKAAREAEAESRFDEVGARRAALRLELAGALREAWWTLAAARNSARLAVGRLETARALASEVQRRYQAGDLSRIDANLAQMEMQAAEAESIDADSSLLQAEHVFRALTGAPAPSSISAERPATPGHGGTKPLAPETFSPSPLHPQLTAAAAASRSARAKVKVAEESRRAAPEVSLLALRERSDFNESYSDSIGIRLKIPFSSGALVRRESSAAQAEADQSDAEMQRLEQRVELDAMRARQALQAAERQYALAEQRRTLSSDSLRLAEKSFALGEADLATLLRIRSAAYAADTFLGRQGIARAAAISRLNQTLGVLP